MKNFFFLGTALLGFVGLASAQEQSPWYLKADAGMAIGLSNVSLLEDYSSTANYTSTTDKSTNTTLGDGFKGTFGVGYRFPSNFALEAGVIYSASLEHKGGYSNEGFNASTTTYQLKDRSGLVYLNARYLITTHQRFQPYLRLGLTATAWGKMTLRSDFNGIDVGQPPATYYTSTTTTEYKYRMTLGINGAVGCNYKLNDRLAIYGELNMVGLSRNFKKATITKYEKNGVDVLPTLSTSDREVEFKKEVPNNQNDPNKPTQSTSLILPMSYVGLSFGVQFSI